MSNPLNIFLVRHGQSIGNVNKKIYETIPDYALQLTPEGKRQSSEAGEKIKKLISGKWTNPVDFYVSPFWRTRQTYIEIQKYFPEHTYIEDCRLREQECPQSFSPRDELFNKIRKERDNYGRFYYRFREGGESTSDVFDRMSNFLEMMFGRESDSKNVIIITHGMAMRVFLMRFFHCTVEEFESWANPKNCEFFHLKYDNKLKQYILQSSLKIRKIERKFNFNWTYDYCYDHGINKLPIII